MIVVRPITRKDQQIFAEFSFESLLGMTNLPRDREKLQDKIILSESSFRQQIEKPGLEEYYFVLEDLTTGRIGGTCGILAENSISRSYFYRIESLLTNAKHISAPKELSVLKVISSNSNASEVCSLYLQPTFRHSGQGRLLSLSRFLFIAAHRQRFEKKIFAELRGYIDQRQISPFWEAVGKHFCNLSFVELMAQLDQDRTFISEILPKFPIYISLLPKEAQEVIGKTHDSTKPALHMLLQEGFAFNQEIDIFDAGPLLAASTSNIRTIKNSAVIKVQITPDMLPEETEYILSNDRLDFRACFGRLQFISKTTALINDNVADALLVKHGDNIRYVTIH
ncbi:arginine N-succinyltransferase [Candidatus Protochlamydia phocaeensis]|uniref:arginine N-succinyltransferase n=1 Tax=Candidatus Protochlamydia phocaeensis TaxID=1414722 RepID=UPI00083838A2|nr:arginine N-succinyltransferase [Candidatus Protochlamydia phocaeensis]